MDNYNSMELDKIYNTDCLELMSKIGGGTIDLIVTDPPYLIGYETNHRNTKNRFCEEILNDHNETLIADYIKECYRILKEDSAMYMFCSPKTIDVFMKYLSDTGFVWKNTIIWKKDNGTMGDLEAQFGQSYEPCILVNKGRKKFNGKRDTDVWEFSRVSASKLVHQNQKPLELIMKCIEKHSNEGDVVFDGFMGSGTTAVAAHIMKRHFIGSELDPYYFKIANIRIENEINQLTFGF